eukprot:1155033-Pyramimonas_sp.AAC.1
MGCYVVQALRPDQRSQTSIVGFSWRTSAPEECVLERVSPNHRFHRVVSVSPPTRPPAKVLHVIS